MVRAVWIATLLAGCLRFDPRGSAGDDAPPSDAGDGGVEIDGPRDALDASCFGAGEFFFCLADPPVGVRSFNTSAVVDTSGCADGIVAIVAGVEVCVIAAMHLGIGAALGATGSRPLVLAATATLSITIPGVVDAASSIGGVGPGANAASCSAGVGDGQSGANGGGGGAGGSFGSSGGTGGEGDSGTTVGGNAGTVTPPPITMLRGGCHGGSGGAGAGFPAAGGSGGGVVYLVARDTLTIDGTVDASGAAGRGGLIMKGGGGGGGSGGLIVMHSNQLVIGTSARVVANGGGGGGGAGNTVDGGAGSEPDPATPLSPALGSQDNSGGRAVGGNGAAGSTNAESGAGGPGGGGGGGGGAGVIRVLAGGSIPSAQVSPPPS